MKKVPEKRTHFSLPIELHFRAVPTTWTPGFTDDGDRALFPAVSQNSRRGIPRVSASDAEEIRTQFFKMGDDETSVLEFLNSVGVWFAVNDMRGQLEDGTPRVRAARFQGTFGHRYFNGKAGVLSVEYLTGERKYWRELFRSPAKLRKVFGPVPTSGDWFTLASNTLPIHLEWRDKRPYAVIQPITGTELLTALAWMDLISGAAVKVCQKCGDEYKFGRPKYCRLECERAHTKRAYRRRVAQAEAIVRANSGLSMEAMSQKLAEAGIERKPEWIAKVKAK